MNITDEMEKEKLKRDKAAANSRAYYAKNKEILRKKAADKYRSLPPGEGAKRQKERRASDPEHKEKAKTYARSYREGNDKWKRSKRNTDLKKRYGLSIEEYEAMLEAQDNKCALCKTTEPGGKGWCVDHCHDRNSVRAILCRPCNLALGAAKDNPTLLRQMADYVEKFKE